MRAQSLIRPAGEKDRAAVALCIAKSFDKDFSLFCKDSKRVSAAIAPGLDINSFFVAETESVLSGTFAISNGGARAARAVFGALIKNFGLMKGFFAWLVLKNEFERPAPCPEETGYIEFVAVDPNFRRRGIAKDMLRRGMEHSGRKSFMLDVIDTNFAAIECYKSLGFVETGRVPEKHPKQAGFNAKIYMSLTAK